MNQRTHLLCAGSCLTPQIVNFKPQSCEKRLRSRNPPQYSSVFIWLPWIRRPLIGSAGEGEHFTFSKEDYLALPRCRVSSDFMNILFLVHWTERHGKISVMNGFTCNSNCITSHIMHLFMCEGFARNLLRACVITYSVCMDWNLWQAIISSSPNNILILTGYRLVFWSGATKSCGLKRAAVISIFIVLLQSLMNKSKP